MIIVHHDTKKDIIGNFVPDKVFNTTEEYHKYIRKEIVQEFKDIQIKFKKSLHPNLVNV
jgi:hypothetical protein